jgi:RND family efflux transporter MFP subunit
MWKKLILLLLALLILALVAWQYLKPEPLTRVSMVAPVEQTLSTNLDLNAVVINDQVVTITALLDGEISSVVFREGEKVKKQEVLAVLDNKQAQSLLNKARAEFNYAKQKVNTASRSYSRIKNLSNAGNTSKQNLDESLDQLRGAQAEVEIAEANITLAEIQLQNATIESPFDGIVTQQHAEVGQWVEAGTPLFNVVAENGFLIEAQVDASDWAQVTLGQTVSLSTETAPDKRWQSTVAWIAPRVSQNRRDAKSVAVRFEFGEESPKLLLGQEVDAKLELQRVDNALTLPLSAMHEEAPNAYVVYVVENNKAKRVPVELGLQNATYAEIKSGIGSGDKVIAAPLSRIQHDMTVDVVD